MAAELKRVTGSARVAVRPLAAPGVSRLAGHYHHLRIIRRHRPRGERRDEPVDDLPHPRSFKSQMVTVRYPAWLLESDPMTRIIVASYNQSWRRASAMRRGASSLSAASPTRSGRWWMSG